MEDAEDARAEKPGACFFMSSPALLRNSKSISTPSQGQQSNTVVELVPEIIVEDCVGVSVIFNDSKLETLQILKEEHLRFGLIW